MHVLTTHKQTHIKMNTIEYGNDKKIFKRSTWWGIKWYPVFVDWSYYSPVIVPIETLSFLVKHVFIATKIYNALYWKVWFARLLQVKSQIMIIL